MVVHNGQLRQSEVSFVMCVSVWCVDRDLGVGGGGKEGGWVGWGCVEEKGEAELPR